MKNRGFEKVSKFECAIIPKRSTKKSAGYDFHIIEKTTINPGEVVLTMTGIKSYMLDDEVLKIYPRSSLAVKKGVQLANSVGIIDADYYNNKNNEGHIMIPLYNFSSEKVTLEKEEKIAQGIFVKFLEADNEDLIIKTRSGGFGSTD